MNNCSGDCSGLASIVPYCRGSDAPSVFPYNVVPLSPYPDAGLFLQLFDFKAHLLERNLFKFKLVGLCMYPFLKSGDILTIENKNSKEIKIGDIAVFRRYENLYVHRVIHKGIDNGLTYIVTRSDSYARGNDGSTFDKDILGIVTHIERKGRAIQVLTKDSGLILKFFSTMRLKWFCFMRRIIQAIIDSSIFIQRLRLYRKCAKIFLNKTIQKITYAVRSSPSFAGNYQTSKEIAQDNFCKSVRENTDIFPQWTLFAFIGSKHIASASFVNKPPACPFSGWWAYGLRIKARFRGGGIEEELLRQAERILASYNASRMYTRVRKNAVYELSIYKNAGFKETDSFVDMLSLEQNASGAKLILEREI